MLIKVDHPFPPQLKRLLRSIINNRNGYVQFLFGLDRNRPFKDCKFIVVRALFNPEYDRLGDSVNIIDATPSISFMSCLCGNLMMDQCKTLSKYHPENKGYISASIDFVSIVKDNKYYLTMRRAGTRFFYIDVTEIIEEMLKLGAITEEELK